MALEQQQRPLDRPTLVKPQQRSSVHIQPGIIDTPHSPINYVGETSHLESPPTTDASIIASMRLSGQNPNEITEMDPKK